MTLISILIFITIAAALGLIVVLFYEKNRLIKINHKMEMVSIIEAINIHKTQVSHRNIGLNNYDFTKYNLKESLVVQSEIKLF